MSRKTLLAILGVCLLSLLGTASPNDFFTIKLPSDVLSEHVGIQYFLTGGFGGYGGFVASEPRKREYSIETSYEGKPARTLKAIVYAKGCRLVLLDVPSLSENRSAEFDCIPLPDAEFEVLANIPKAWRDHPLKLEIDYLAYWSHPFFGIVDGFVASFPITEAIVPAKDTFPITLPNFAEDPTTKRYKGNAALQFVLREADTGNVLAFYECHGTGCALGDSSTDRRLVLTQK
jgi:hypothetical protein